MILSSISHPNITDPITKIIGSWSEEINVWSVILRVVLSLIIGGIIGAERAKKHHVAGLRTLILVCLGSCVAAMTNEFIVEQSDASRMPAGVLTGIGFLGAGTIIVTQRNQVRGLTTAAALWAAGCVGCAIGVGYYTLALATLIAIIIVLVVLPKIEGKIESRSRVYDIHVELYKREYLKDLIKFIREKNIDIKTIAYDSAYAQTGLSVYTLTLWAKLDDSKNYVKGEALINEISSFEYVNFAEILK